MENTGNRLKWVDILRGILILTVVIGHATGRFNQYIYQFHMGAFFIVSGYMSKPEKRPVVQTIYHRSLTTYLPILTATVFLALVMALMYRFNCYTLIMGEMQYIGFVPILREFFMNGNLYVWWLGAAWFALVLFELSIFNRLILAADANEYSWRYVFLSILLFLLGYVQINNSGKYTLVWIAQLYFMLGTVLRRKVNPDVMIPVWKSLVGLCLTGAIMGVIGNHYGFRVDYSSYSFNNPLVDVGMSVNGFLFCFFAAKLIEKLPYLRNIFVICGQNTLPIMLFHFMWFNMGYWLLYKFGIVPLEYIGNFIPTDEIGRIYWPLFTGLSVALSILIWKCLTSIKFLRIIWGLDKKTYDKLWKETCDKFLLIKEWLPLTVRNGAVNLRCRVQYSIRKRILSILCCVTVVIVLSVTYFDTHYVGNTLETSVVEAGIYEDGWCEDYVRLKIKTGNEGIINLKAWTNIALTGEEEIVVHCNGVKVVTYQITDAIIDFTIPAKPKEEVSLEIYCNFRFQAEPPDVRELAFVIQACNSF